MERDTLIYKIRRKLQAAARYVVPKEMLCSVYSRFVIKKSVNISNPTTFNEKIQWCKLHYYPRDSRVVRCADKYAVRDYVREKGLGDILVPLLGVWDRAEDIPWEKLPAQFVLKCNHGCAYNILCPDSGKFDWRAASRQLNQWLREDFGAFNLELHYSRIKPRRIICEEYLGACITDYKFFCFNGNPELIYVSTDLVHDRLARIGFFDLNGEKLPMTRDDYEDIREIELPPFFDEMKRTAQILCRDFPFVRVDFFVFDDRFYFAELTFTPGAGMMPFNPEMYDAKWGEMLHLEELVKVYGK